MIEKKITILYSIESIQITDLGFSGPKTNRSQLDIKSSMGLKFAREENNIVTSFIYSAKSPKEVNSSFNITIVITFHISNWDELDNLGKGRYEFPEHFILNLLSIAISTSRGIIFSKSIDSPFSSITIPLLLPKTIYDSLKKVQKRKRKTKSS